MKRGALAHLTKEGVVLAEDKLTHEQKRDIFALYSNISMHLAMQKGSFCEKHPDLNFSWDFILSIAADKEPSQ